METTYMSIDRWMDKQDVCDMYKYIYIYISIDKYKMIVNLWLVDAIVYREWISNKILLCSMDNYIQYPVTSRYGKEHEKEYIYI